jgi:dimethylaniline monooxygenase (N-oxide forming)
MEVCIIGGGYSAIISAKVSISQGLTPFILNKSPATGGLWKGSPNEIGVWRSITANNSKYITCFSDQPWETSIPDYPTGNQFLDYLSSYIEKHNLSQFIHNNCEVSLIERSSEGFLVYWTCGSETHSKYFKYVIIASGRNAREVIPFSNSEVFQGTIIKGGDYREPSVFQGKNVLVIGRSFTASDIALDALETAKSVSQIYRKPYLIIRKYLNQIPSDFFIFSVHESEKVQNFLNNSQERLEKCKKIIKLMGNPSEVLKDWKVDEDSLDADHFNVSVSNDAYYSAVSQGSIKCVRGSAAEFYENGVVLHDGRRVPADGVVVAMGYQANYSFLSKEIQDIIQYDPLDKLVPVILYRAVCHPDLPGLCFVGNFSNHAPGFEVEAEMGVKFLTGNIQATYEEMSQGVRTEEDIRKHGRHFVRAYDSVGFTKECLKNVGVRINYEMIKEELGFGNGPLLPCFYYLDRPGQLEICRQTVKEIKEKYPEYGFA